MKQGLGVEKTDRPSLGQKKKSKTLTIDLGEDLSTISQCKLETKGPGQVGDYTLPQ